MAWVSHAEAFPLNGNEEQLFTTLDILEGAFLIAILDREGIDDKEGLEEREAIEDPMLPEAGELLDCPAFVGAIAFIVR
jgi:hypothetical protein